VALGKVHSATYLSAKGLYRVLFIGALGKIFVPSRHLPLTVTLPSGRPALGKIFYFFTLPSAPSTALGKVFFFFFL
jgi:hypothetical protein